MPHATRNYRLAQLLLLVSFVAAGYCLDRMVTYGLGDPNKAKFWFSMLAISLFFGIVASIASYYYRVKRNHSSGEEIAIQALAAAGSSLAKTTTPATPTTASDNRQPENTSDSPDSPKDQPSQPVA